MSTRVLLALSGETALKRVERKLEKSGMHRQEKKCSPPFLLGRNSKGNVEEKEVPRSRTFILDSALSTSVSHSENFVILSFRHQVVVFHYFHLNTQFSCCYRPKEDTVSESSSIFVIYHPNGRTARFTLRFRRQP